MNIVLMIIGGLVIVVSICMTITEIEKLDFPIKGLLLFFLGLGITYIGEEFELYNNILENNIQEKH
jgi:hypothetical protein